MKHGQIPSYFLAKLVFTLCSSLRMDLADVFVYVPPYVSFAIQYLAT